MKKIIVVLICLLSIQGLKAMEGSLIQNNGQDYVTLYVGDAQEEVVLPSGGKYKVTGVPAAGTYNLIIQRPSGKYGYVGGLRGTSIVSITGDDIIEYGQGGGRPFSIAGQEYPWGQVKQMSEASAPAIPGAAPAAEEKWNYGQQRRLQVGRPGKAIPYGQQGR